MFNQKVTTMKKIMTLAIIAIAAVAMVACSGQPKKTGACGEPCCQPKTECVDCTAKPECPKAECTPEKCAECPKKADCPKTQCAPEKCAECPKAADCPNKAECATKSECPKAKAAQPSCCSGCQKTK